ncbi:lipopolysaccharide heptosyltransferase I [Helicobacter sp. 23-1044]
MQNLRRIAIVRLSALGDVVISASVLGLLRECLGEGAKIEWFVDERFSGILRDSPCIDVLHALPFKKYLKSPLGICRIYRYMRKCGDFDAVLDMQGLLKSALIGRMLKSKKFVGFGARGCRERVASALYSQCVDICYDANILARNFALIFSAVVGDLGEILRNKDAESQENAIMNLDKFRKMRHLKSDGFGIDSQNLADFGDEFLMHQKLALQNKSSDFSSKAKRFLFIIEASITEKIYPIAKFIALAKMLKKHFENINIYVVWSENESGANALVCELKSQNINATKLPKLDFNNIKFVLKNMDVVIGGDTGITHLGWVLGAKTITLLGNAGESSGKNMRHTRLKRILLGNPYVLSKSGDFEIGTIAPSAIFACVARNME